MSFSPTVAFLTDSAGTGEWIVLFVVVLVVVGPKRLPEVARKLGRMVQMFRRAADEFKDQIMTMDQEPPAPSAGASSGEGGADSSYHDAYPNLSDYPGNEGQVENWHSEAGPETGPETAGAAEGGGGPAAEEAPAPAAPAEKPPEAQA